MSPTTVLMISPAFPMEMPLFTRGLARVGARVIGLGEQPQSTLPPMTRESLDHYHQVERLWDEEAVIRDVRRLADRIRIDRIECLWEPGVVLAARLREDLGLPGMGVEQTLLFRDKESMKLALDAAGIRTPRHARASSADGCRAAAEGIGYPLIVKPIAGAGSADTHRVDSAADLDRVLAMVEHVPELSIEEFIDGEEYTFDTISVDGRPLYYNISWYRPCPLLARTVEWMSPQTVSLRRHDHPGLQAGRRMGLAVLEALGYGTGFTHMEWFLTSSGEPVFGEIAARAPGAVSVDLMNFAGDIDTFTGWAEAVCYGTLSQRTERPYNAAVIFKRAAGMGRIRRIEGLERLMARYRQHIVCVELLPPGTPRRNWKQTLLSDGYVIVRSPDLSSVMEMADRFGTDLRIFAEEPPKSAGPVVPSGVSS